MGNVTRSRRPAGPSLPPVTLLAALALALAPAAPASAATPQNPAATPAPAEPEAPPAPHRIDLALFDGAGLPRAAVTEFRAEVERIFAGAGVEVGWVDRVRNPDQPRLHPEIRVVLAARAPAAWGLAERVMGTVLGSGYPRASVYVFYPAVLRTVGRYPFAPPEGYRPTNLERGELRMATALARVAAHEVVHTLAPGEPHARSGLMKRRLDAHDLLTPRPRIDDRFRAAFARGLLAAARAQRLLLTSPEGGQGRGR